MVFSSLEFICFFLPVALAGDWISHRHIKVRNAFLFVVSLFFYSWGEPKLIVLLLSVIFVNWLAPLLMERYGRWMGAAAIVLDVGILFIFKYFNWMLNGIHMVFGWNKAIGNIALPIGISFYTFQAISYVADIMSGNAKVQKSLLNVGLYISFFPQLVAGPIVRYADMEKQILDRRVVTGSFSAEAERFMAGFSKKILLADSMAVIADQAWSLLEVGGGNLGLPFAWLGAAAYTFQMYFDFSAYSDMAVGLAGMFGFRIPENFNEPYRASSVRDFWRRWHISLSIWFRDYVYIPLGGNRVPARRMYANIAVVWLLTGLWHGANLTFLVWGSVYGLLVIAEKLLDVEKMLERRRLGWILYRIFTFLSVMMLWLVFRAEHIGQAFRYIGVMFDGSALTNNLDLFVMYLCEMKSELTACALVSFVALPPVLSRNTVYLSLRMVTVFLLFIISVSYLVKGSYSPFLYFNF